ncbi:SCO family protein [Denitrobaculum tricleocarpae]|uniref:SCO family protein n=1 Tax=Denitrobaculum tricleocarpae TaxID=2591009 RepID=A0A545TGS2_9PROT|nr:SCO family protein [Denitrobaculum tricleocarpae]TQV76331.1 SCO family protein [Denitrobaculum tricleocarpae]
MPQSSIARAILIFGVGLVLMLGAAAVWMTMKPATQTSSVTSSGEALIGGPFELVDQFGEARNDADFLGDYMLIYFGYTYCPDVCPTSLGIMTQAIDQLETKDAERAARIKPVFITVDPERDDVETMKVYAEHFHPNMVAMTGSTDQVASAARAYRVYYAKVDDDGSSDYLMDHSSIFYLMGPDGKYVKHFTHNDDSTTIATALAELVETK